MTASSSRRIAALAVTAFVVAAAWTGLPVVAQSSATELSSCTAIDESGEYVLTNDIGDGVGAGNAPDDACLRVAASDVTIDGNGHTIAGDGSKTGVLFEVTSGHRLSDVTVTGWEDGVALSSSSSTTISGATITDNARYGIRAVDATDATLTGSTVSGNELGIYYEISADASVVDSDISDNRKAGIAAADSGVTVRDSTVEANGGPGIDGLHTTFTVVETTVADNEGDGVSVDTGEVSVDRSVLVDNAGHGLHVADSGDGIVDPSGEIHVSIIDGNGGMGVAAEDVVVDARRNWWGADDGPSSAADADAPFEDPSTGLLADGNGQSVSEGASAGVSNVRFDPYYVQDPRTGDAPLSDERPTETATPTPDPTATPTGTPDPTPTPNPTDTPESTDDAGDGEGGAGTATRTATEQTGTTTQTATGTEGGDATSTADSTATATNTTGNGSDVAAGPSAPPANNSTTVEGDGNLSRNIGDANNEDTSSGDGPGFGVLAALVALVAAALLATRRDA
ncbi:right-handed parallel beta-helix repeat-containing protein [Halomarina litorea]|uniref:right-handed parallel beta-helix repeat-containing protein n=1 Tax=Halomarina litorea TaxID=2961595 RepID=UPI0020C35272|nr:right-handed parallel beta-helix repeat-containing protein [Halomarina sp. BCD28]